MKKLLSLILAATLLIGLVPCAFAAETSGNEWVFSAGQHDVSEETLAAGNFNSEYGISHFNGTVSDAWGFVNIGGGSEYDPEVDHILYEYNLPEIKSIPEPDTSNAIALELDPDTSGTFNPTITVITETTAPIYEVYLIEKPANSSISVDEGSVIGSKSGFPSFARNLNKSKRLGLIDAYGTGALKTVSFPAVTVDADTNYWLILSPNGANENREGRKATSGGVAYYRATLKLVSFTLTNKTTSNSAFFNYDITTNALSETAQTDYGTLLASAAGIGDGDLMYVSWKSIYSTSLAPAIDTTKTTGYQLYGRNTCDSSLAFNEYGMTSVIRLAQTDDASTAFNSADWKSKTYENDSIGSRPVYAIRINVPVGGKYSVSILNRFTADSGAVKNALSWAPQANGAVKGTFDKGTLTKVHLVDADDITSVNKTNLPFGHSKGTINNTSNLDDLIKDDMALIGYYDSTNITTDINEPVITTLEKTIDVQAGEYYLVFDLDKECFEKQPKAWGRDHGDYFRYYQVFMLSGVQLTPVSETNVTEIQSNYDSIVNVDVNNGEDVATTIENAEVKAVAADISGKAISDSAIIPAAEVAVGSSYTADAPEIDGYKFLYWAKGIGKNRKIVSHNESYSFKVTSGGTLLMAVYKKTESDNNVAMFYNGNGQLLATQTGTYTVPTLPSMAGYGTATHWALHGSDEKFTAGATGEVSGEMRFVAQYDNGLQNVTVTVVNGTGGGEVAYGSDVTVTASVRNGTNLFNYWTNENGEILSFDKSYTFKALKDSTLTAVYKEYIPVAQQIRKIIMTSSGNDVFAEFAGIENVIERGILFGENASLGNYIAKVTMNTDANHFAVNNDLEDEPEAIGYAILANGNVIYSK